MIGNANREAHFKRLMERWQQAGIVEGFLTADQIDRLQDEKQADAESENGERDDK